MTPPSVRFFGRTYVTQARPRHFVFRCEPLHPVDCVAVYLLLPDWMQGTRRARCFYARLLSCSLGRSRYGVLVARRHTAHQKRKIMVLGFLARRNCFRDDAPRYHRLYRDPSLFHRISPSLGWVLQIQVAQPLLAVRTLPHFPQLLSSRTSLPLRRLAAKAPVASPCGSRSAHLYSV